MRRREFVFAAIACVAPCAGARAAAKLRRIGWLTGGSPKSHAKVLEAFRRGLRDHGWVEGQNIVLELRWAEGDLTKLPALAEDLVRSRPDVILTAATPVNLAMKKATSTIPIVMASGADPVGGGVVASAGAARGQRHRLVGFLRSNAGKDA